MKKRISAAKITVVLVVTAFIFGLPVLVSAAELDAQATQSASAPAVDTTTSANDATTMTDPAVPLSNKPYEYGWALFNLLATGITAAIAVFLAALLIVKKIRSQRLDNSLGLSAFAFIAAALSIVLFAGTEPLNVPNARMILVDSYSVAHISVLVVAILCAVLTVVREVKDIVAK